MQRRQFITVFSGAAVWPLAAYAQQALPIIAFVRSTSLADAAYLMAAFRQGLKAAGFVEGQNVIIQYRSAEDQPDLLRAVVADLVRQQVTLIIGNNPSARAAKAATATIPIVFVSGEDPVVNGLVASLNRPGANVTGVSFDCSADRTGSGRWYAAARRRT
jgi:putative ABC transport system substrate-binding protein